MLAEMTPAQLVEWQAALDVVGVDQIQRQVASLESTFMAAHWDKEKDGKPPTTEQRMGLIELGTKDKIDPIVIQSPEEIAGALGKLVR